MVDKKQSMTRIRDKGVVVRGFIIDNLQNHPSDIVKVVVEKFGCSRQAVNKHIQRLIEEKAITQTGKTRNKTYNLAPLIKWEKAYSIPWKVTEDQVWREDIVPSLGSMATNVLNIWHYGFTEMFNNALEHSDGKLIHVQFQNTAANTEIVIYDNGIGIFKKIQSALGLLDERHAVLELAKGKFTTDPSNHSGEGIFFSSRMFDNFTILSGEVYFSHDFKENEDWILQSGGNFGGTSVRMKLRNLSNRTTKKVFDTFSIGDDYGFTKTIVPVELTQYGDDNLVSRSQAKRMLVRIEKFKIVVFDFAGVTSIGQAFADEVFRVFAHQHPDIEITAINTDSEVKRMISRAKAHNS
jgi:anti-sigma regulatory factor (Ser/Thr protein kinase)/biotin operon repressor